LGFGACDLGFFCYLDFVILNLFGICYLVLGISLLFGFCDFEFIWDLLFGAWNLLLKGYSLRYD
jgi:hypothetical protein